MRVPTRRLPEPRAMVVTPQPEATDAGAQVLACGGNPVDATVAAALVQGVVDPLMCGVGGFGLLQVHLPDTGQTWVHDGLSRVPAAARADQWADQVLGETTDGFGFIVEGFVNEAGAGAVMVPGVLPMLAEVHSRYGRLPWADLVSPAIGIARRGWILRPHTVTVFTQDERRYGRMNYGEKLALTADGRRLYCRADGSPKGLGELVVNPDLAETLQLVATEGAAALTTGALAGHIADQVSRHGGLLSAADLATFRPERYPAQRRDYRGWQVSVPPAPGGGPFLLQALGLLERLLTDPGAIEVGQARHLHLLAQVMLVALRDKERYGGDRPDPLDRPDRPDHPDRLDHPDLLDRPDPRDPPDLLDPGYLDRLARAIQAGRRTSISRAELPGATEARGTTHVSAMDRDGMAVSLTHTLGNPSGFIPAGTGFMLNGGMSAFDPRPGRPNSIAAGKRRLSTMCPTLILEELDPAHSTAPARSEPGVGQGVSSGPTERVVASLGAPGASWIGPALLQVVSNLLDWGMDIAEAIAAPRIAATGELLDISNRISHRVEHDLTAMGYQVRRSPLSYAFGGVHGITAFQGRLRGGADPQRDGYPAGVP